MRTFISSGANDAHEDRNRSSRAAPPALSGRSFSKRQKTVYCADSQGIGHSIMSDYLGSFPSAYASVAPGRHAVVDYAAACGFTGDALNDIESSVGEALANAAEHGHAESGAIAVSASMNDRLLTIEIKDSGRGFAGSERAFQARQLGESPRGFGIFIMRELMDVVEYSEHGSRVRIMKRLVAANGDLEREA